MPFTTETAKAAGRKGGLRTKKVHGLAFYARNGKKGTKKQKEMKRRAFDKLVPPLS